MTPLKPWAEYVDLLKNAGELETQTWDPADEEMRAALYKQFAMNIAQGYFLYFQSDPAYPDWAPFENSAFLAPPNPDAVYYYRAVDGGGTYRVTGERGNVDALKCNDDGTFEVTFSTERPAGHEGNWLYLHPESRFLLLRQFSYDWGRERDVRIAIERLDVAAPRPAQDTAAVDRQLRELFGNYVRGLSRVCLGYIQRSRNRGRPHEMRLTNFSDLGNSGDWPQAYFECIYDLQPGEALILETDLPERHQYWNVQVIDALWNQVDLVHRQSSLNGLQARLDPDGKFRAVLSVEDPGVHNWLDTGGGLRGMLIGRWYRCSSHPTPRLTKVKFSELNRHLPDTPSISPAQRAEALRARRVGAQLRRRW